MSRICLLTDSRDPSGLGAPELLMAARFTAQKRRDRDGPRGRPALAIGADAASLQTALRVLRPRGTVIDLAFHQGGAERLRMGEEFHHNGLNLRCAQINRVPRGLSRQWDRRRPANETVKLLAARGAEIKAQLITHVVPLDEAPVFLTRLVAKRPEFLLIVFKGAD